MLDSFIGNADNLSAMNMFGYQRNEDFERDVLTCFDSYGATFLAVTRGRGTAADHVATSWSFAFHQHVFIAVQAPDESRAFASARDALGAGHRLGNDFGDTLAAWAMLCETYAGGFIPSLSDDLKRIQPNHARPKIAGPPTAEELWAPFELRCVEASLQLATTIDRQLADGAWGAGAKRRTEDADTIAARVWAIHLEYLTIGYLACDAYSFSALTSADRDRLMDEVARILFANFKKLWNPRGPQEAIDDLHSNMFRRYLAQYEEYGRMLSENGWPAVTDDFATEVCRVADVTPSKELRQQVLTSVQPLIDDQSNLGAANL